jgi:hypothetical protein
LPVTEENCTVDDLARAYETVGFVPCADGSPEPGFEKVALYGEPDGFYTHAARQLPGGRWTSKLGALEDIEHETPDDVVGGVYGAIFGFMKQPLPS